MASDPMDLTVEIAEAKKALEKQVRDLEGSLVLLDIFNAAHSMAESFSADFEQLRWEARLAFTKAIVVEYAKPWSNNQNPGLTSAAMSKQLRRLVSTQVHKDLVELRNVAIAHADATHLGLGVTLQGFSVANDKPNLNPRTLDRVFLPFRVVVESSQSIWWIDNQPKIEEIAAHIGRCKTAAQELIGVRSQILIDTCLKHIHVLQHLTSLLTLETLDEGVNRFDPADRTPKSPPKQFAIGTQHLVGVATAFSPGRLCSPDTYSGNGFKLVLGPVDASGSAKHHVFFPSRTR